MNKPLTGPYYGLHEEMSPDDSRQTEWAEQRATRGFDNTELWNLDITIAKFILPRLIAYKEVSTHTDDKGIDKMIVAFEAIVNGDCFNSMPEEVEEGLKVFHENYFRLWL
jgi:hypothetical protein